MKPNQKIIKINDKHSISILTHGEDDFEIAHLVDGDVSYTIINDPIKTYAYKLEDEVQDLVARIVQEELESKGYDATLEVEGQVIVETFTYNIWIAVCYYRGKLSYSITTTRDDDDHQDRNATERKTWKGLMNTVERFDV